MSNPIENQLKTLVNELSHRYPDFHDFNPQGMVTLPPTYILVDYKKSSIDIGINHHHLFFQVNDNILSFTGECNENGETTKHCYVIGEITSNNVLKIIDQHEQNKLL